VSIGEPSAHGFVGASGPWPGAPPDGIPRNTDVDALVASLIVAGGARRLFGFQGVNNAVAATFVQVFDTDKVPSAGAVPKVVVRAAASDNFSAYFGSLGRWHDRGIVIVNSSTLATFTASTADLWLDVQFY
jgi:hypothetical protein